MLMLDKTSERLRSKHVRTLELLQKTLDENAELRDRISQLQKGTLQLGQSQSPSNRTNELEDEIDRLKAEHCAKQVATEEAARVRRDELQKSIDALQTKQQQLQNDVFSLETKLSHAREALQHERIEWHRERQRLQHENQSLRHELEGFKSTQEATSDTNEQLHAAELSKLQSQVDAERQLHVEANARNDRLHDEMAALCAEVTKQQETIAEHRGQLDHAQQHVLELQKREISLRAELEMARVQIHDLEATVDRLHLDHESAVSLHTETQRHRSQLQLQEEQYVATLHQLHEMEEQNRRLVSETRSLHDSLAKLQTHHAELTRTNSVNGSVFATHIDLKRENFHLRAQIDELKALQRRFLTTANKKTMKFPAI